MRHYLLITLSILLSPLSGFGLSSAVALTKVEMANALQEGDVLESKVKTLKVEKQRIEARKQDLMRDTARSDERMSNWNRRTESFNSRCGRDFLLPQEQAAYNACAQEQARDRPEWDALQAEQQRLMNRAMQLRSEDDETSRKYVEAKAKLQSWRNRMNSLVSDHSPKLKECFLSSSGGASETIVREYERCWDLAGQVPATRIEDPSGLNDPMVGKPDLPSGTRRTPQQAIDEYRNSGRETSGPNTLKTQEPPSPGQQTR